MTRFARKTGLAEKKENTRKIEEATKWNDMIKESGKSLEDESEKIKRHEDAYNEQIEFENTNSAIKKKKKSNVKSYSKEQHEALLKKYSETIDKEVLDDLNEMKRKYKLNDNEFLDRVMRESRSNIRRVGRATERDNKRVCFKCRKPGHPISECPLMNNNHTEAAGICFKCGSTEHAVQKCKVKTEPGHFPYAKCFICHETGHITKQCPDNPRGLYPNGGACKHCSSVEHYAKDCPEAQKNNLLTNIVTARKIKANENFDDISDDDLRPAKKVFKPKNKVVKF